MMLQLSLLPFRKRKEWEVYEPIIDILSAEEAEILDQREEVNAR